MTATEAYFHTPLSEADEQIWNLVCEEERRQQNSLELIAPKNYMSRAVREAHDSIFAFTSVEGYPGKRWHAGVRFLDVIERLAIERACETFGCAHANVQPHSGTQANQAALFACAEPGDRLLSMALDAGGHLSHGLTSNLSGRWFEANFYGVDADTGLIDYEGVQRQARELRPKVIICGGSSYPRVIDFQAFGEIATEVDAVLVADIAHIAGLVAAGQHPSPFPHCDIVTTTTNKNLRGPRGGLVLCNTTEMGRRIDAAVFPGVQGGPLPEFIVAKAVALGEALSAEFEEWAAAVLRNAQVLASKLQSRGFDVITGGTDTPLVMVDLRSQGLTGVVASDALETAGIACNKNLVPGDPEGPTVTSGLRFGTSGLTTRGLRAAEMDHTAEIISDVLEAVICDEPFESAARRVCEIAQHFPLYDAVLEGLDAR
jgi:glycine hydroxymethyltransferase